MRRCAVWMVLVVLCLTTGCRGSAPAAEPVGEQFTCTIQALYRDLAVEGTLTRATAGTLTLEFDKPDTLNGAYELVCDGNSGVPLSLSVPSLPLTVTFSNFQSKS